MQLSEIRSQVRERTGVGVDDPILTNTVITSLINSAIRRMTVKFDWPWLEQIETKDTTADTSALGALASEWVDPDAGLRRMERGVLVDECNPRRPIDAIWGYE